jgi:hypothetical protein
VVESHAAIIPEAGHNTRSAMFRLYSQSTASGSRP